MRTKTRGALALALVLATVLTMHGCGGGGAQAPETPENSLPVQINSITFEMAAQANNGRPVKVALVQFTTPSLGERLAEITPQDWFSAKGERFRNAHPNAYYDDWEIVPGHITGPFELVVEDYVSAMLFCETRGSDTALRVSAEGDLAVHIETTGCEIYAIR